MKKLMITTCLMVCLAIPGASIFAQDMPGSFAGGVSEIRSSPFDPPVADAFVADVGEGLDTGCTYNTSPDHPLHISLAIDRYVGPVDAEGYLLDPESLVAAGVLPELVRLTMPAYDVDIFGPAPPEHDEVYLNGHYLGLLTGENNLWLLNSFMVEISRIRFPAFPGAAPAINEIDIIIDVLSTARWCAAIDWVAIIIPVRPNVSASMNATGYPIAGNPNQIFWEQQIINSGSDCSVADIKTDYDLFPLTASVNEALGIQVALEACPVFDQNAVVTLHWSIGGTGLSGLAEWTGSYGHLSIPMPAEVGAYALNLELYLNGVLQSHIVRKVLLTWAEPLAQVRPPSLELLELALDWAGGESSEEGVLRKLMAAQFEHVAEHWQFGSSGADEEAACSHWSQMALQPEDCSFTDAFGLSGLYEHMAAVMGIAGLESELVQGEESRGFLTQPGLVLSPSFRGNVLPVEPGAQQRYAFSSHRILRKAGLFFDPTFNQVYHSLDELVDLSLLDEAPGYDDKGFYLPAQEGVRLYMSSVSLPGEWSSFEYAMPGEPAAAASTPAGGAVRFSGPASFSAQDLDSDGMAEGLLAELELEILEPGQYQVFGFLSVDDVLIASRPDFKSMHFSSQSLSALEPGKHSVRIRFSGEQILRSALDGPYQFHGYALGEKGSDLISLSSPAVLHTEFGELGASLELQSEVAQDISGNGLNDLIRMSVDVDVRGPGSYMLSAFLTDASAETVLLSQSMPVIFSTPGLHSLTFPLNAQALAHSGLDGPYRYHLQLTKASSGALVDDVEGLTQPYAASSFDAVFRSLFAPVDAGIDLNGNGLFDLLQVTCSLAMPAGLNYRLSASLTYGSGAAQLYTDTLWQSSASGLEAVVLFFDGKAIRTMELNGPYSLVVELREAESFALLSQFSYPAATAAYLSTDFETEAPGPIALNGYFSDSGVDPDANGLFDHLELIFGVSLEHSGSYQWSANLEDASGNLLDFDFGSAYFAEGSALLRLTFDGQAIGQAGVNGPYLVKGLLVHNETGQSLVAIDAAQTGFYSASQFEGYSNLYAGFDWAFDCDAQRQADISGIGFGGRSDAVLSISDPSSVDSIVVQVIASALGAVPDFVMIGSETEPAVLVSGTDLEIAAGASQQVRIYQRTLAASEEVFAQTPSPHKTWSMVVYVFRNEQGTGHAAESSAGHFSHAFLQHGVWRDTLALRPSLSSRDVRISIPVTGLAPDDRQMMVYARAGSVQDSVLVSRSDRNGLFRIVELLLRNVPGDVSELSVEIVSPEHSGASFVFGASVSTLCNSGCSAPANLSFEPLGDGAGSISWDAVPGHMGYRLEGRVMSQGAWLRRSLSGNSLLLNHLDTTQIYEARVGVRCADMSVSSYTTPYVFVVSGASSARWSLTPAEQKEHPERLYPNPASKRSILELYSEHAAQRTLRIQSLNGSSGKAMNIALEEGWNRVELFVQDWAEGIYTLSWEGESTERHRLLVIR